MASFHFKKIELESKCDPHPQLYDSVLNFEFLLTPVSLLDLGPISEQTLISVPIDTEIEPSILDNQISLMGNECEFQLFYLDPTFESNPTLEPELDLCHILNLVLILVSFTFEPKLIISSKHILLLDQGVNHYDSEMIFQD